MADLLVPAVPPAKAHYALQAASFESGDAAGALAAELAARGHRTVVVPVSDADHPFIVAVGDFPTPEAARAQQFALGEELKSVTLAPVIMLPAAH
ncbi:SPOR domain-containing protein [Trinickia caryophylli]